MDNIRGSVLMVVAMLAFAIVDAIIKQSSTQMPVGQILIILGTGASIILSAVALWHDAAGFWADARRPVVVLRNLCEVFGSLFFVTALSLIPLSTASAVLQAAPLLVTIGAALFLGEAVGWRRWTAIAIGLFGVLLILRPGFDGFDANVIFAILGVIGLAARDLVTRTIPKTVSSHSLAAYAFIYLVPTGFAMMAISGDSFARAGAGNQGQLFIAIFIVIAAYYAIIGATRFGNLSAVSPFRYSRIVFALILGAIVFGERPDALTLTGALIVVATGLYTLWRESRLNRHKAAL